MAKKTKKPTYKAASSQSVQVQNIKDADGNIVYENPEQSVSRYVRTQTVLHRSGVTKKYECAGDLREACMEYFVWAERNPMIKTELIRSGILAGTVGYIPVDRPFTIEEMCQFINLTPGTWQKYRADPGYIAYHETCQWAEEVIRNRKIQGAYIGIYNPLIASRDLGLVDKSESEQTVTANVITGIKVIEG